MSKKGDEDRRPRSYRPETEEKNELQEAIKAAGISLSLNVDRIGQDVADKLEDLAQAQFALERIRRPELRTPAVEITAAAQLYRQLEADVSGMLSKWVQRRVKTLHEEVSK